MSSWAGGGEVAADTAQASVSRRELLSLKTNVLFYGIYMPGYDRWCPVPNVAVEYFPRRGHFTYGASFDFPWWIDYGAHKFFEIRNYQIETRYYIRPAASGDGEAGTGAAYRGFYVQGYAHAGIFEIGFDSERGWKGEGFGAGVGAGYVVPLSASGHWRLELSAQLGWFGSRYDPFRYENLVNPDYHDGRYYYRWAFSADSFRRRQYRYTWFGPTRVGVSVSYDLVYRRRQSKGIGLRPYEPVAAERRDAR